MVFYDEGTVNLMRAASEAHMRLSLLPARQKQIIHNLMQFYFYDFTEFLDFDVNAEGMYSAYPDLELFFTSRGDKFPFLITYQQQPAGFALVERIDTAAADYYLTEFFVMKKYRRSGLGTWAAKELFDRLQGSWKVTEVASNVPAQAFWRKVIHAYTNGSYREEKDPESGNPSQYLQSRRMNKTQTHQHESQ
ncbi:acetyltransferase, GNAT family [Paenibacillus algicola]|uniref:Acetyltransferase, GNAT family n=2 Tax=Paenibacillus algicola TaxID=2565926 RepID=A0A4P8XMP9_9BACL|nr:acetyltransferase, GNAT family [Paenibacillus algicola]